MKAKAEYYVYIMTNITGMLYTGVTNDLERRVYEHKMKLIHGFTLRYNLNKLVFLKVRMISWPLLQEKSKSRVG
jgi:putative endonuclease